MTQNEKNYHFSMFLIDYTIMHDWMIDTEIYRCAMVAWERFNNLPYDRNDDVLIQASNTRLFQADMRRAWKASFPTS